MAKRIHPRNLPVRFEIPAAYMAIGYLLLDKFHAPEWLWGIAWFVFVLLWIGWIVELVRTEYVNLFKK